MLQMNLYVYTDKLSECRFWYTISGYLVVRHVMTIIILGSIGGTVRSFAQNLMSCVFPYLPSTVRCHLKKLTIMITGPALTSEAFP